MTRGLRPALGGAAIAVGLVLLAAANLPATAPDPTPGSRGTPTSTAGQADYSRTTIFFSPHQDDETISMGAAIVAALQAHRHVIVVQVTDGSTTGALGLINTELTRLNDRPEQAEHPYQLLTPESMSDARDREQAAALAALGLPAVQIIHESKPARPRVPTQTAAASAKPAAPAGPGADFSTDLALLRRYLDQYPGASFATMSWLDMHPDHYYLGYALDRLCGERQLTTCTFFQSPLYQPNAPTLTAIMATKRTTPKRIRIPKIATPMGSYVTAPGAGEALRQAVVEYQRWDPASGRYAVGGHSVKDQLNYTVQNPRSWGHQDSNHWASSAKVAAQAWIKQYQWPVFGAERP